MLESILSDVMAIFRTTFMSGDWVGLAIAVGAVIVATLIMRRGTQIGSMTLMALVLFAFGGYMRNALRGPDGATGFDANRFAGQLEASWSQFTAMQAGTLFAYFLAFMIFIFILFALKSILSRG